MADTDMAAPKARARSGATSVQIGPDRIAYLDALAEARGLPSRAAALFAIWTRAALVRPNASRLAMPALPPAAAPITAPMRLTAKANGKSVVICQLSGPDWVEHGADALALVERSGAPLSRIVRAVIDSHMLAHGGAVGVCEP